jgi:hypothetical protein
MLLSVPGYFRSASLGASSQMLDPEDGGNMALRNVWKLPVQQQCHIQEDSHVRLEQILNPVKQTEAGR